MTALWWVLYLTWWQYVPKEQREREVKDGD